ncbi:MAG: helix-turn-helix domain-containing protein [Planctomycetes bacterium]|nr:helix-turn-helix domain-containing protein [Planctomycetota bacterium]
MITNIMHYAEHATDPAHRAFIDSVWSLDSADAAFAGEPSAVLPDACVEIVLPLAADEIRIGFGGAQVTLGADCPFVVGALSQPLGTAYWGRTTLLAVRLDLRAAARVFGSDLAQFAGGAAPLAALSSSLAREVSAAAGEASRAVAASRLARVVAGAVRRRAGADARLERALLALGATSGKVSISSLARDAAISSRQLDRVFHRWIGLGPKTVARIMRFRSAWEIAERGRDLTWAAIAASAGYADQSHLVRDFREFAGGPPTEALPLPS